METLLFIPPDQKEKIGEPLPAAERRTNAAKISGITICLSLVVVFALTGTLFLDGLHQAALNEAAQVKIGNEKWLESTDPRNVTVQQAIDAISENAEAQMTNQDWLDNELETPDGGGSQILIRDIQYLRHNTTLETDAWTNFVHYGVTDRDAFDQIDAWESNTEQKITATANDTEKIEDTGRAVERAIVEAWSFETQTNQ
jgi:hypothetical protein